MNAPQTAPAKFALTGPLTITPPALADGELWAGIVTTDAGLHHVILLPGDQDCARWEKQIAWTESIGGSLPDRVELATLRCTLPDEFKPDWYWSCEQHAVTPGYAWYQHFDFGYQGSYDITTELRARAVRRVAI